MKIEEDLKRLAEIREILKDRKTRGNDLVTNLEQTPQFIALDNFQNETMQFEDEEAFLTQEIRNNAYKLSEETGFENRKPINGVQIKQFKLALVKDDRKAKTWLAENAPDLLKIGKIDKIVENLNLDWVEKGVEYRSQIASDLSEYLK